MSAASDRAFANLYFDGRHFWHPHPTVQWQRLNIYGVTRLLRVDYGLSGARPNSGPSQIDFVLRRVQRDHRIVSKASRPESWKEAGVNAIAEAPAQIQVEIPAWVQYEIDHPKGLGEGRNNQMIKIGPTLIRSGLTPEQVEEIFQTMFPDGPSTEIDAVVKNSMKFAKAPAVTTPNEAVLRRRGLLNDAANALPRILKKYAGSVPEAPKRSLEEQRRLFLTTLFKPTDVLWIGEVFQKNFMTLQDWLQKPAILGCFVSHCTFKPESKSRSNENVAERKYLVVESDKLKPQEAMAVFHALEEHHGLTPRALVSTGGKSIHAWFDWDGDADDWAAVLKGYQCDPATLRPSQPVRLSGIIRPNTGRPQELIIP